MKKTTPQHHTAHKTKTKASTTIITHHPASPHPAQTGFVSLPETWLALAFVIFLVAIFKPLKKSIFSLLDGHTAKVKAELDEARALREEAEQLLIQVQQRQKGAFAEAEKILARAQEDAKVFEKTSFLELETMLQHRKTQALEKIALMETAATQNVRNAIVDLALAASQTLLAEKLTSDEDRTLLKKTISQLPKKLH